MSFTEFYMHFEDSQFNVVHCLPKNLSRLVQIELDSKKVHQVQRGK